MNPFKSYTLKWWQVGLLKVSMLALGLVVGATWPEAFATWTVLLWILFAILAAYLIFVGFGLMVAPFRSKRFPEKRFPPDLPY